MANADPSVAMADERGIEVLHWAPRYLNRSERFVWQQLRDWRAAPGLGPTTVACRTLTPVAAEFPHEPLVHLGPPSRLGRSLDHRLSAAMRRAGRWTVPDMTRGQASQLRSLIADADVVYAMFLWNAIELLHLLGRDRTPLVVHVAGSDIMAADARGAEYVAAVDAILERADRVLCGSAFLHEAVCQRPVDPKKVEVHHFGIDVPDTISPRDRGSGPCRVAAISRLHPVKGVAHTIRAFAAAFPDDEATLTIAGDGPDRAELESLAASTVAADRIAFLGEIAHDDAAALLATSDLLVQHNVTDPNGGQEGLGGTLLEAGAHGLPVVATRSGGVPEGVVDGQTGILVTPGDEGAMADGMRAIASDPELADRMGRAGRSFVDANHNARTQNLRLAETLCAAARTQP